MTREEILNMEAGREMDAMIAVAFFGWKWVDVSAERKFLIPPENDKRISWAAQWDADGIPDYLDCFSTDVSKANLSNIIRAALLAVMDGK